MYTTVQAEQQLSVAAMERVAPPPPPAVKPMLRRSRLQWLFVWRTPGFKALKANLAKHMQKVEEAKEVRIATGRARTWCRLPRHSSDLRAAVPLHRVTHSNAGPFPTSQASGSAGPKNIRKKEQRLEQWQRAAGQQIANFNMRAGFIVSGRERWCVVHAEARPAGVWRLGCS